MDVLRFFFFMNLLTDFHSIQRPLPDDYRRGLLAGDTEVAKIQKTIKTLIIEFMTGNSPGHIREIHLRVTEFRPEVPQHTVRARLSEMARTENLEEKVKCFGRGFYGLYEQNRQMCSKCNFNEFSEKGTSDWNSVLRFLLEIDQCLPESITLFIDALFFHST